MRAKKCNAQLSVEFIIILSIILVVFLTLFSTLEKRNSEVYATRTMLYAREVADNFASTINTIFLAGEGTKKTAVIPETLRDDSSYTIDIYPLSHAVEIRWNSSGQNNQYTATLITGNITGSLDSLHNRTLTISNRYGGIIIG
jgi:hypothetical protein